MSSNNKRLKLSEPSREGIVLRSLPEAKRLEFLRLCALTRIVETDEDVRGVFESLKASPEFARVVDRYGETLLHSACDNDFCLLEMIQYLVDRFPKALQQKNSDDQLPLHAACNNSSMSLEVIRCLVEKYPKALEEGAFGDHLPLHDACQNSSCSLDIVRHLVEKCPEALEKGGCNDNFPLHGACQNEFCSLEVIRCLLEQCPSALEQKNKRGMLPLHSCILCFKLEEIDFPNLLKRMRLLLPKHLGAMNIVPHDANDDDWLFWQTPEEHGHYKEVAGLLLEEIPLRDQWEWARQVVEVLSWMSSSTGVDTTRLWATEWRDVCRERLDEIEARLAALENLLVAAR